MLFSKASGSNSTRYVSSMHHSISIKISLAVTCTAAQQNVNLSQQLMPHWIYESDVTSSEFVNLRWCMTACSYCGFYNNPWCVTSQSVLPWIAFLPWELDFQSEIKASPRVAGVQNHPDSKVISQTPAPWEYIVSPKSYCTMKCHSTLTTRGITLPWK